MISESSTQSGGAFSDTNNFYGMGQKMKSWIVDGLKDTMTIDDKR